jgi:hypothetical protein
VNAISCIGEASAAWFARGTPTPYPSPQGGGGFCIVTAFLAQASESSHDARLHCRTPLPLVGRGDLSDAFDGCIEEILGALGLMEDAR